MTIPGIGSQGHIDFLLSNTCLENGCLKKYFIPEAEIALSEVAPGTLRVEELRVLLEAAKNNPLQS